MNTDYIISTQTPPAILDTLLDGSHQTMWIGALSTEERCSASITTLAKRGLRMSGGLLLDYETDIEVLPSVTGSADNHWEVLLSAERALFKERLKRRSVSPYAFLDFQALLESILLKSKADFILFDITCLTKIHLLALAATLAQTSQVVGWGVVYTKPESYIALDHAPGWRDIIIAPLGNTGSLLNEAHSRGVIIPGHEDDRLTVGLSEMEASGGVVLMADTPGRPDLHYITERRNRKILRSLTKSGSGDWVKRVVVEDAFPEVSRCVSKEIEIARRYGSPIMLFPYGPKSLVFAVALQLSIEYPEWSWFVYPVPLAHVSEFSEGTERLIWAFPAEAAGLGKSWSRETHRTE